MKQEACILADVDGDVLLVNQVFEELSAYREEDIAELQLRQLLFKEEGIENPLDKSSLKEFEDTFFLLTADLGLIRVSFDCKEIEGQKFLCVLTRFSPSGKDTGQTQAAGSKPVVSKPVKKSELGNLSHLAAVQNDIRTALGGIVGYGSLLLRENSILENEKLRDYSQGIMRISKHMQQLLDKTFLEGRHAAGRISATTFPLGSIFQRLKSAFDEQLRRRGIDLAVRMDESIIVSSDEERFYRVFHFLIEKAVLFSRSGDVELSTHHRKMEKLLEISINDIGMDIPQAVVHHIQRENNAASYRWDHPFLNQHEDIGRLLFDLNLLEARMSFETTPSLSQKVKVIFPDSILESPEDHEKRLQAQISKKKLKILVVEDDEVSAHILNMFLLDVCDVVVAYSGNEALNFIEHHYKQGDLFNVLLLDINLPAPWDGIMLKNEIIERFPEYANVPFIAQTANVDVSVLDKIESESFFERLFKPISKGELLRILDKAAT